MTVDEIMTPQPVTIDGDATLRDAAATMAELEIRHLPVVDRGRVIGMISDRDLATWLLDDLNALLGGGDGEPLGRLVADVMSADVLSVGPESPVGDAIDLMLDSRVGALAVVDERDDTLVGILSYVDVLRAAGGVL